MSSTPFISTKIGEDGNMYVLIRQSISGGLYSVDICLNMDQFSSLMALLRGLEMYFMDMELKKSVSNFSGFDYLTSPSSEKPMNTQTSCGVEQYNPEKPTYNTKSSPVNTDRPTELILEGKTKKLTRKRKAKDNICDDEKRNGRSELKN